MTDVGKSMIARIRTPIAVLAACIVAAGAMAAETKPAGMPSPKVRYTACMDKAKRYPKDAFEDAIQWRDMGGGGAAEHCAATALVTLGLYKDAGARLESLAQRVPEEPAFKAEILGQAAQAWLLADMPARAEAAVTAALKLQPGAVELLIDRSQARAQMADYKGALADLDAAIATDPKRPDAFAFRAAAKRYLEDRKGAAADIERALALDLNHAPALLERGNLRRLAGDDAGARADWLMVLSLNPDGAAGDAARANLERMDVKNR
jgi:tetratricopeptide (TPR) repeat protein